MTISHTVRLRKEQNYEMEHFTFSITAEDLPTDLTSVLTTVQIFRSLEYIVQRELVNLQVQSGHMFIDDARTRIEYLRKCLGDDLEEKLVKYGC